MKSYTIPLTLIALSIIVLAGVLLFKPFMPVLGEALSGTSAYLQYATTTSVGPNDSTDTIFTANDTCKSRVVSTLGGSAIMLNFGEPSESVRNNVSSTTVSGIIGHWQAASTTVAYDGGLYGCGTWSIYSYATQTITISEF